MAVKKYWVTNKNQLKRFGTQARTQQYSRKVYTIFVGRTVWKPLKTKYPFTNWNKTKSFMDRMKSKYPKVKVFATHRY